MDRLPVTLRLLLASSQDFNVTENSPTLQRGQPCLCATRLTPDYMVVFTLS